MHLCSQVLSFYGYNESTVGTLLLRADLFYREVRRASWGELALHFLVLSMATQAITFSRHFLCGLRCLRKAKVFLFSLSGHWVFDVDPKLYNISKFAVTAVTESLRLELKEMKKNIRASVRAL